MDKPRTAEVHNLMNGKGHYEYRAGRAAVPAPKFIADQAHDLIVRIDRGEISEDILQECRTFLLRVRKAMGYE